MFIESTILTDIKLHYTKLIMIQLFVVHKNQNDQLTHENYYGVYKSN